jgi:hypothetical protein
VATEPTPTDAEIGAVMQLVLQCTDARLAWDSDATAESYAAWKASLAAVRDRLARWGAQPAPADSVLEDAALLEFEMLNGAAIDRVRKQGANHD